MINREGKLNLSTSGGSDLNQDLVENSEYTKSTHESDVKNDDGVKTLEVNTDGNKFTEEGSSFLDKTKKVSGNADDEDDKKGKNTDGNYKVSDMNSRMNPERDAKEEVNEHPTERQNTLTKSDVPYDVPNDQTPTMTDLPKNYEQYSKKGDKSEPADE